ncbi:MULTISPECIES: asparagine synthase-related protein [Kitasatospora]|uniref:Asparagine synthase-related protein n=1 Tax=Kitasatospora cathayae TaxID=3004092 RepID=A0ABY7PXI6_9ACTN|nr:asparagine synthase-related protein [Kitasatospora sp. HUAS 3-15]WBP84681.1 asparagine synthase-related protein [Kitasatospora sp. HUAS 3-15]
MTSPVPPWRSTSSTGCSVLVYLMRPQVCVTVRYPGQDRLDESATAAAVARDIGAELVVIEPTIQDFTRALPEIMHALDYPMGNASTFSEHMACRAVAERACGWWSADSGQTSS